MQSMKPPEGQVFTFPKQCTPMMPKGFLVSFLNAEAKDE
jgi:hypothetical protein